MMPVQLQLAVLHAAARERQARNLHRECRRAAVAACTTRPSRARGKKLAPSRARKVTEGIRRRTSTGMPSVTYNMILGPRAYHAANRGIPARGEGILGHPVTT